MAGMVGSRRPFSRRWHLDGSQPYIWPRLRSLGYAAAAAIVLAALGSLTPLEESFVAPGLPARLARLPSRQEVVGLVGCSAARSDKGGRGSKGAGRRGPKPLSEKTFLVTGGTGGIGKTTVGKLLKTGACVIIHGRREGGVYETMRRFRDEHRRLNGPYAPPLKIDGFVADFGWLDEVRELARLVGELYPSIDGILHNAGTVDGQMLKRDKKTVTLDGHEHTMSVNVLAPFLLTSMLMRNLQKSSDSRVVFTGSDSMRSQIDDIMFEDTAFLGTRAYAWTKLCNAMLGMEMHDRFGIPSRRCFHTIHPGAFNTKLRRHMLFTNNARVPYKMFHKISVHGFLPHPHLANRSFQALVDDEFRSTSGIIDMENDMPPEARSPEARARLWDQLVKLTGAKWPKPLERASSKRASASPALTESEDMLMES